MKKSISKSKPTSRKSRHYSFYSVAFSPGLQQQLLKYGKVNVAPARCDLGKIAEAALNIALLHRDYLQSATKKFVAYCQAEGFEEHDQYRLIESLLKAKK